MQHVPSATSLWTIVHARLINALHFGSSYFHALNSLRHAGPASPWAAHQDQRAHTQGQGEDCGGQGKGVQEGLVVISCGYADVFVYACFYDTSMLASMTYLWATVRDISLLATNSFPDACFGTVRKEPGAAALALWAFMHTSCIRAHL
jgi:hypothetical protein